MTAVAKVQVDDAVAHWAHVMPVLTPPENAEEYEALVAALDNVLDAGGADETNLLAVLADRMGDLVAEYEEANISVEGTGIDALRFLMEQHGIKQSELPEVGSQGVVSEVLSGKRELNGGQAMRLRHRFGVSAEVFLKP